MLGFKSDLRELTAGHAQRGGKVLDKRAAAGRACLVEQYALDLAVLYAHALHILTADIENELDTGEYLLRSLVMRHSLDLAVVNAERRFYKVFAISGSSRFRDICTLRHKRVYFFKYADDRFQRVTEVVIIKRIEYLRVLVYKTRLCCGGARVYAEVAPALVGSEVRGGYHAL